MVSVMLYTSSCILCIALSMDLIVLCVMELLSVGEGSLLNGVPKSVCDVPVIPGCIYMLLPYVLFLFVYVGSYLLIYEFESWITDIFSPHVVSLCTFVTICSEKSLQLLCILPFGMLCLSSISMFVKILLAV